MEQDKNTARSAAEQLDEAMEYETLMEQVDEIIGHDLPAEEPDIPAGSPEAEEAPAEILPEEAAAPETGEECEPTALEPEILQDTPSSLPDGEPQPKKKRLWLLPLAAAVLAGIYIGLCAYANAQTTFYPGRHINGVDVGGMTAAQAQTALETALSAQQVTLTDTETGETLATVPLMELGYDPEDFAGDAQFWLESQQAENFLSKGITFANILLGNYPGGASWPDPDDGERTRTLTKLADELHQAPVHAAYELGDGIIRITKARDGRTLNVSALADVLAVPDLYHRNWQADISFETIPAETFTAQELHDEVYGTMANAFYDPETNTIVPDQTGVDFNTAAAQAAINGAEPGQTLTLEAAVDHPAVTAAELEQVLFRDVLGEWKTHVSGTAARINNVKLSAASINGYVMNAGDEFSYNNAVGKRTAENGYQAAPAYIRGETVDEIGGGICQTSSTLYYACLLSQLEIVERYPHRYVPAYIPWGMDATVSWGGPDYRFANNTVYPIKIVTEYAKNYLTVKILGTRTLDTTVKMTNEVVSTTPWVTEYVVDETLTPGTPDQEKTSPYTGYKVLAYRNLYDQDGKLISSTLESTNNYKVRNQVIVQAPPAPQVQVPVVTDPVTGQVEIPALDAGAGAEPALPGEADPFTPAQPPAEDIPASEAGGTALPEAAADASLPAQPPAETA